VRVVRLSTPLWQVVGMWTGALYIGLLALRLVLGDPDSLAYDAGRLLSLSVLSGLAVGLLARYVLDPWPEWLYPLAIFGVGLALVFGSQAVSGSSDGSQPASPGVAVAPTSPVAPSPSSHANAQGAARTQRQLVAPRKLGEWRLAGASQGTSIDQLLGPAREQMQGQAEVVGGFYAGPDGRLGFMGFNLVPGGAIAAEASDSPEGTLRSFLQGMGVVDVSLEEPGSLGGVVGCGPLVKPGVDPGALACAWVDGETMATVTYTGALDQDAAAAMTLDVRAAATVEG
jgi:hypothetical protein